MLDMTFDYEPWRHGGWYVCNVRYPSGAVGCVSRNYADRKWRIVCDRRPGAYPGGPRDFTYRTRDDAAAAERFLIGTDTGRYHGPEPRTAIRGLCEAFDWREPIAAGLVETGIMAGPTLEELDA